MRSGLLALAIASVVGLSSCATASPSGSVAPVELTVLAAASLGHVLGDLKAAYESAHPGTTVTISTDSSTALEIQIEQGAPADVFLSADTTNPRKLVDGGFADGQPVIFAGNELTIITPTDNPGGLTVPFDLARDGVRIIAAGDEVPITRYARELVERLAAAPGSPPTFAAAYAANTVSKEDNVGAVRAKIELGEGEAAIVYVTDAAASDEVATVEVPDSVNVRASYAGVVVRAASDTAAAHALLEWLAGPDAQAVIAEAGFLPASS